MRTPLRFAALATIVVVALTGCVRVQIDLTLTPEETVDGTMVLALQEGIGELLDTTDAQAAEQLFGETAQSLDEASITKYSEDGYVGQKVSFQGQPMGNFALDAGDFTISRDGDNYVVNGPVDPALAANGANISDAAQMWLSVTFPGAVYEHNGSLEGRTVTWDLTQAPAEIHAVGAAQATSETPGWLPAAIGIALILAVAVVLVIALRRREPRATSTPSRVYTATPSNPQPSLNATSKEKNQS
ncbi:LppM family (lipo)protein [Demequina aurantiaca]|uniref:LppM family (lipo)protein n=1 Tax=Demequina aurantiaca TaxID=676200 RepID=UPI003D33EB5E